MEYGVLSEERLLGLLSTALPYEVPGFLMLLPAESVRVVFDIELIGQILVSPPGIESVENEAFTKPKRIETLPLMVE